MAGTVDLLHLIRTDWRRNFSYLLGGGALFSTILLVALYDLGQGCCPDEPVAYFSGLKILFFTAVYGVSPLVLFTLNLHLRIPVLLGLPLSRQQINLYLLLNGLLLLICCLPFWALVIWQLPRHGILLHPWVFVFTALGIIAYQLFGMLVNVYLRALVAAIFPLLIFPPHSHEYLRGLLEAITTPWPTLGLALLIPLALPRILNGPLPRKTRLLP